MCLLFQTYYSLVEYTDWSPTLQYYYPYMDPYIWPLASIAQTCEVWIVVLVSADRYLAICKPLQAPRYSTMSRMRKAAFLAYVLSILYNLPRFWEFKTTHTFDPSTNKTVVISVGSLWYNKLYYIIYKTCCYFLFRFFLPLLSLVFFNVCLIRAVKKSYKQRSEFQEDQTNQHSKRLNKETNKYTMMLVSIVVVFVVCVTPDNLLRMYWGITSFFPDSRHFSVYQVMKLSAVTNFLLAINSCSNFVIYCFMGNRFRKILYQTCSCK